MGVYTVKQKAWHERFREAGVTAVIGLGADRGCPTCCVGPARTGWTASTPSTSTGRRPGWARRAPRSGYSLSTILAEFANPSLQFVDGALREMPARSGREMVVLPAPWGPTSFMFSQHSEPLTVPFAAGIAEKGIQDFTWRLSLPAPDHAAWEALVRAGFGDYDTPVTVPGGTVRPLDVLAAVLARQAAAHPPPAAESHEIHLAIGRGTRMGQPLRVTAQVVGRPHASFEGMADPATSLNMSIAVQQIGALPLRPGVWAAEEYFEPDAYLEEVRKRHFEVTVTATPEDASAGPLLA